MQLLGANWKTTLGGIVGLGVLLCGFLGIDIPGRDAILGGVIGWIGMTAKDSNVTGGSVKQ